MLLTIGMAVFDDFEGVFYTVQALRMYHDLSDCEIVVVDNNPASKDGEATKAFIESRCEDIARYVPYTERKGSCPPRGHLFDIARGEYTLCIDAHVLIEAGAIKTLKQYLVEHPNNNLMHGPLLHNDLSRVQATEMDPRWASEMFGVWRVNHDALASNEPFDIPQHGLGLFCSRTADWLRFHPNFNGFSGGEGYLHEKYRQAGRRVLCLPFLKWMHKFARPNGCPHRPMLDDKVRNHLWGWDELGMDLNLIWNHFVLGEGMRLGRPRIPADRMLKLMSGCGINNFTPDRSEPRAKPNPHTGMIIGPTNWGYFRMRGAPVADRCGWPVQTSRGRVSWDGAETCLALKCDVPPIVRDSCRRIIYMPGDQWFESREQMSSEPVDWLIKKCRANKATDLILESPALAGVLQEVDGLTVHVLPHHADPRVQADWYHPHGPIVYAGHRAFVERGRDILIAASKRLNREIVFDYSDTAWRALQGASLVIAMRYDPYATEMHRFLKPAVKVANAAAAGIPVLATDDPAITSIYDVVTVTKEQSLSVDAVSAAMHRAIESGPQDLPVYTQGQYVEDLMEIMKCAEWS